MDNGATIIDEFNNKLKSKYLDDLYLQDYLKSETNNGASTKKDDIEYTLEALRGISKEDLEWVFYEFLELLSTYLRNSIGIKSNRVFEKNTQNAIASDSKTIKKYQKILLRSLQFQYDEKQQKALGDAIAFNQILLNELETKNFKYLSGFPFYEPPKVKKSKQDIKDFLEELQKSYGLKSTEIKQLIDIL